MVFGYVFAVLAALASDSGSILESLGVRRAHAYGGRSLDLVNLRGQPVYFLGIAVDMLGFLLAAAALRQLPLFLVQSLLAFSVGVTATISAFMGTRLAAAGWLALGIGAAGLILLGVSADPGPARPLPPEWRWFLLAIVVPVAAIAFYAQHQRGRLAAPLLAFGAGLGFCVVGVSARTLELPDAAWQLILEPSAWAIPLNGLIAAASFAMALQKSGATANTAILFTTNTALSSLIGVVYLDDRVRTGFILSRSWDSAVRSLELLVPRTMRPSPDTRVTARHAQADDPDAWAFPGHHTMVVAPITSDVDRSALNRDFAGEGSGTRKPSS